MPDVSGRTVICLRSSTIGIILDELFHWGLVYRTGPIPGFSTFRPSSKGGCIECVDAEEGEDRKGGTGLLGRALMPEDRCFGSWSVSPSSSPRRYRAHDDFEVTP